MKVYCVCRSNEHAEKIESPLQSTIVISTAFFFVFASFMSIQALQNSLNIEAGLGVKSLACLYSTCVVSSLLSPAFIKVFGGKLSVVGAFICHTIYTISNFYPRFYTLIPSSLLLGMATGPLWTTQNLYITASASRIAKKHNKDLVHVLNKHNGIFFSIMGLAFALGSIVSSVIFRHDINIHSDDNVTKLCGHIEPINPIEQFSSNSSHIMNLNLKPTSEFLLQLFSVYLGFDVIGVTITILLLPTLPLSDWIKKKSVLKSIYSMATSLSNAKLLLFLPMPVAVGIQRFVLFSDFTRAYITCPFGVGMVGFAMASYAITNTIVVQIMPRVVKYVRRQILLAIATVINVGEMIMWLFWNPTSDQLHLVFISVIAWGITDSIWKLETFGTIPLMFAAKKEPAFANLHFWRSLSSTVYFGSSCYLSVFTKLIICISALSISMTLYGILEVIRGRDLSGETVEQELKIDEEEKLKETDKDEFE